MLAEDLTGRTFGKRYVSGPPIKDGTHIKWRCVCICGFVSYLTKTKILAASGCRHCNAASKKRPYQGRFTSLCCLAKGRCSVELTYEEYLTFAKIKKCHYCGKVVQWNPHGYQGDGHHLDRKDNSLGYSRSNCVVCCARCNRAKSNHFTYEEWVKIGALIKTWQTQ